MKLVVMVCTANACRSPMAEGLLREQLQGRISELEVVSAGIMASLGGPTPEGVTAMAELNIDIRRHRSRQISETLMEEAVLVIPMTQEHARWLCRVFPAFASKVRPLGELARGGAGPDVPDPVGLDLETYRRTARMIRKLLREAEPEILERLEA